MNQVLLGSTPLLFLLYQVTNHMTVLPVVVSITDDVIFGLFLAFSKWQLHIVIIIISIVSSRYEHAFTRKISYQQVLFNHSIFFSLPMLPLSYPKQPTTWMMYHSVFSPPRTQVKDSSSRAERTQAFESGRAALDSQHHHLQLNNYGHYLTSLRWRSFHLLRE